jgi:hypothetical protein
MLIVARVILLWLQASQIDFQLVQSRRAV